MRNIRKILDTTVFTSYIIDLVIDQDVTRVSNWKQMCISGLGLSPNRSSEDFLAGTNETTKRICLSTREFSYPHVRGGSW